MEPKDLPEHIRRELFNRCINAKEASPEEIVYREKDLLDILEKSIWTCSQISIQELKKAITYMTKTYGITTEPLQIFKNYVRTLEK